nr:lymphocyte expansion molecule-like [Leptinotarsa decemlineata]
MTEKSFKTRAPFGTATKRFNKLGFHPELDASGAMKKQITKVGPGSYDPQYPHCKSKKGICWKTKLETELVSKFLDYRNAKILYERELDKTLRGPGSNDVNENLYKRQDSSVLANIGFGTGERFKDSDIDHIPAPNTYFRKIQNTSTVLHKNFSNLPTFERDGFSDRFKSNAPKYTLAPNWYHPQDGKGIDAKSQRVVSLRGPYDLFTGPRDESTIKNHFGVSNTKVPDYFFVEKSTVDVLLHHPSKSKTGKFQQGARFTKKPTVRHMLNDLSLCYRNPRDPGPAHYDLSALTSIQRKRENMYAFNTSKESARPPPNWTISPGPGRYTPKAPRCMKLKRPSWVFLSKIQRRIYDLVEYNIY